jgi:hypothetical protein
MGKAPRFDGNSLQKFFARGIVVVAGSQTEDTVCKSKVERLMACPSSFCRQARECVSAVKIGLFVMHDTAGSVFL